MGDLTNVPQDKLIDAIGDRALFQQPAGMAWFKLVESVNRILDTPADN
jgi:hypothetical protein